MVTVMLTPLCYSAMITYEYKSALPVFIIKAPFSWFIAISALLLYTTPAPAPVVEIARPSPENVVVGSDSAAVDA